ncbi:hypothetical protein SOVF_109220, partial [Spinacia oleracea]
IQLNTFYRIPRLNFEVSQDFGANLLQLKVLELWFRSLPHSINLRFLRRRL